jgi:hypothetical protein
MISLPLERLEADPLFTGRFVDSHIQTEAPQIFRDALQVGLRPNRRQLVHWPQTGFEEIAPRFPQGDMGPAWRCRSAVCAFLVKSG